MPFIIKHSNKMLNELNQEQKKEAQIILNRLAHWHGEMHETSIGATIYSVWQFIFYSKLFAEKLHDDN